MAARLKPALALNAPSPTPANRPWLPGKRRHRAIAAPSLTGPRHTFHLAPVALVVTHTCLSCRHPKTTTLQLYPSTCQSLTYLPTYYPPTMAPCLASPPIHLLATHHPPLARQPATPSHCHLPHHHATDRISQSPKYLRCSPPFQSSSPHLHAPLPPSLCCLAHCTPISDACPEAMACVIQLVLRVSILLVCIKSMVWLYGTPG